MWRCGGMNRELPLPRLWRGRTLRVAGARSAQQTRWSTRRACARCVCWRGAGANGVALQRISRAGMKRVALQRISRAASLSNALQRSAFRQRSERAELPARQRWQCSERGSAGRRQRGSAGSRQRAGQSAARGPSGPTGRRAERADGMPSAARAERAERGSARAERADGPTGRRAERSAAGLPTGRAQRGSARASGPSGAAQRGAVCQRGAVWQRAGHCWRSVGTVTGQPWRSDLQVCASKHPKTCSDLRRCRPANKRACSS